MAPEDKKAIARQVEELATWLADADACPTTWQPESLVDAQQALHVTASSEARLSARRLAPRRSPPEHRAGRR